MIACRDMGFKSFLMKKTLQMKGVDKDQAEKIAKTLEENPEMAKTLKSMEDNKELKALLEKIQSEIEEKKKAGMPEQYAAVQVMGKYKSEIAKYRNELAPLMQLMMSGK
ncbi:MAG TPA: hypothetical protein VL576_00280 [Candidatus Paceibacterota bacterium]|jgi:hypothetical protein|nr:hypothetical protein [Candidatus Paceibacterota bacterium]